MHFVYILRCADTSLYTGYTNDLSARLKAHQKGKTGAKYTRSRRPLVLVYQESFRSRTKALKREYEIKQWPRAKKVAHIRASKKGK